MRRLLTFALLLTVMAMTVTAQRRQRVACIGNSITYGYLLENPARDSYPSQLQRMLGDDYEVGNFGHSGATLLRRGHRPYNDLPEFRQALDFRPDIAVIHLGVNDTDPRDWPEFGDDFVGDYLSIIDSLRKVNPDVRILIARLTPLGAKHFRFKSGTRDWRLLIQDRIESIAAIAGCELIDFDRPLRDRQNLMPDGIHPDVNGATLLAETVYGGLTGDYGGLQLPEYVQSGMIVQRDKPFPLRGRANAGSKITAKIGGRSFSTVTDNRGDWLLTLPPMKVGAPYTLTVTDGHRKFRFDDILAGELWLASGQSNMEFTLGQEVGGQEAVAGASDPLLRIYDMKPIARTDDVEWPDSIRSLIDQNRHFRPTRWQPVSPENASGFSAIAYHFARTLRDSLQVPVGVISNAVGGSTCESWVDINTLEREMPEDLVDWLNNDYVQKWCQGRARKNSGDRKDARHPYEPSYLFANGIRQLEGLPLAGVIWYQGESNAHNVEIYERLFTDLTDSWRRHFNNPELPFYFAQLSSLNRPSWPTFRDAQRRLADSIDFAYMTVTSDRGDSLDVHPRDKRPIGERMGRQALHFSYGYGKLLPAGPTIRSARPAGDGSVVLTFDYADGLRPAECNFAKGHCSGHCDSLLTFEIAEYDGYYLPAKAEIIDGNRIKVSNKEIRNPRFVRYGWQPFTRANLVNSAGLPASTFKIAVTH